MPIPLHPPSSYTPSHYAVLDLPLPPTPLSDRTVRTAYRRALNRFRADKNKPRHPASPSSTNSTTTTTASSHGTSNGGNTAFSMDQVTRAFLILVDPDSKREYDRTQLLRAHGEGDRLRHVASEGGWGGTAFWSGLEIIDLADMVEEKEEVQGHGTTGTENMASGNEHGSDESVVSYYRDCRCGAERGFFITEDELMEEMDKGEILVGCYRCSLWARVTFALDDD